MKGIAMGWQKSLPAVSLLALASPAAHSSTRIGGPQAAGGAVYVTPSDSAPRKAGESTKLCGRRRGDSEGRSEVAPQQLTLACEYLRCRSSNIQASSDANLAWKE